MPDLRIRLKREAVSLCFRPQRLKYVHVRFGKTKSQ
jgi:hypothetical protein